MDTSLKRKIESFAWDCTIGGGGDPEDCGIYKQPALTGLEKTILGRPPTKEELDVFNRAWDRCVQEMSQP